MKKCILLFVLLGGFFCSVNAQTAYHGGVGDGYAQVKLPSQTVSLSPERSDVHLQVFPTYLEVSLPASQSKVGQIRLYDLSGRLVRTQTRTSTLTRLSLQSLSSGIYLLEVSHRKGIFRQRIFVSA